MTQHLEVVPSRLWFNIQYAHFSNGDVGCVLLHKLFVIKLTEGWVSVHILSMELWTVTEHAQGKWVHHSVDYLHKCFKIISSWRKIAKTSKTFLRTGKRSQSSKGKGADRKNRYVIPNMSDPYRLQQASTSNRNSVLSTSTDSVTDIDSRPSSVMIEDDELSSKYWC